MDPLCCSKCGLPMRIIAFIERRQTEVIEKILRHCGVWRLRPGGRRARSCRWRVQDQFREEAMGAALPWQGAVR